MLVVCPHCKKMANAKDDLLGKQVRCGQCKQIFTAQLAGTPAAEEEVKPWNFHRLLERTMAICLAVLLHFAVIGVLAWLFLGEVEKEIQGHEVTLNSLPQDTLTQNDEGGLAASETRGDSAPADELTLPVDITTMSDSADALEVTANLLPSGGQNSGEGGLGLDAFAPGGKGGMGGGASFMGSSGIGSRFCIIADRSFSMSGARWEYAKTEVLKTVTSLRSGAYFYVIFFADDPDVQVMPGRTWAANTDASKHAKWIKDMGLGGGTEPSSAFKIALGLNPRPDVIFFMTDGVFDKQVVGEVLRLNQPRDGKKTVIHTICFGDRGGEGLLRAIADQNGGKYRYVPDLAQ